MKVIDLLNMIANGEEAPKTIVHNCGVYNYNCDNNMAYMYTCDDGTNLFQMTDSLNEEVEIIEKAKPIEEIVLDSEENIIYYENGEKHRFNTNKQNKYFAHKINELTKTVNYLLEKEEKWNN